VTESESSRGSQQLPPKSNLSQTVSCLAAAHVNRIAILRKQAVSAIALVSRRDTHAWSGTPHEKNASGPHGAACSLNGFSLLSTPCMQLVTTNRHLTQALPRFSLIPSSSPPPAWWPPLLPPSPDWCAPWPSPRHRHTLPAGAQETKVGRQLGMQQVASTWGAATACAMPFPFRKRRCLKAAHRAPQLMPNTTQMQLKSTFPGLLLQLLILSLGLLAGISSALLDALIYTLSRVKQGLKTAM
jgi:hypothetical protein